MTTGTGSAKAHEESALELLRRQRSHLLVVLGNCGTDGESAYLAWHQGAYRRALGDTAGVLTTRLYKQHAVDITQGGFPALPFRYLGLHELSIDGAEEAGPIIDKIASLHRQQPAAQAPATWLYYPIGEKVGRPPLASPEMLTVAFANGVPGQEAEFREWYVTRHIRHALNLPVLVSGQCYDRTQFQRPGALDATFAMIAMYEQVGTPEDLIASFALVPAEKFRFPMLDLGTGRFAEWAYSLVY